MFLDQDVFFHLGEPYDKPDEELFKERKKELKLLANRTDMLHKALPVLCANAQASSSEQDTMLSHPDLSRRNIFFNDTGTPISLLD
ncbi:hypothetical protein ABVK25_010190 [Lepraria finkii]|uniref:Aminoglycoside phosphotransferase domain-containing protein n=1 Tax=Lepraria finkii TaxID=1340010 RepID=A0ABR4AWI7_9LECA